MNSIANTLILFAFFVSSAVVMGQDHDEKPDPNDFSFIVAGHVYGAPGVKNKPFHPPFMKTLDSLQKSDTLDFAVFTGDIVQKCDEKSWDKVDQYLSKKNMKVLFAAGNHDLTNRELYSSRYGHSSYSFEIGNNLIVILDLMNSGWNMEESQLNQIWEMCDKNRYENILIFSHHVFWHDEKYTPNLKPNSMYARSETLNFYTEALPILQSLRGHVYIYAGDVGANAIGSELTLHKSGHVHMIASGMGGGKWDNIIQVDVYRDIVTNKVIYLQDHPAVEITRNMYTNIEIDE